MLQFSLLFSSLHLFLCFNFSHYCVNLQVYLILSMISLCYHELKFLSTRVGIKRYNSIVSFFQFLVFSFMHVLHTISFGFLRPQGLRELLTILNFIIRLWYSLSSYVFGAFWVRIIYSKYSQLFDFVLQWTKSK